MSAPIPIPRAIPRTNAETPAHTAQFSAGWRLAADWAEGAMEAAGRMSSDHVRMVRMKTVFEYS